MMLKIVTDWLKEKGYLSVVPKVPPGVIDLPKILDHAHKQAARKARRGRR